MYKENLKNKKRRVKRGHIYWAKLNDIVDYGECTLYIKKYKTIKTVAFRIYKVSDELSRINIGFLNKLGVSEDTYPVDIKKMNPKEWCENWMRLYALGVDPVPLMLFPDWKPSNDNSSNITTVGIYPKGSKNKFKIQFNKFVNKKNPSEINLIVKYYYKPDNKDMVVTSSSFSCNEHNCDKYCNFILRDFLDEHNYSWTNTEISFE